MAEAMVTIATTTVIIEATDHIIMAIITIIGRDITQTLDTIATTAITITIGILTKIKGGKTTTEPILITEEKTEVEVEGAGK